MWEARGTGTQRECRQAAGWLVVQRVCGCLGLTASDQAQRILSKKKEKSLHTMCVRCPANGGLVQTKCAGEDAARGLQFPRLDIQDAAWLTSIECR